MFTLLEKGELKYYTIDEFSRTGLVNHCFTTRHGGISKNEFSSLGFLGLDTSNIVNLMSLSPVPFS